MLLAACATQGQSRRGELRLTVVDPNGAAAAVTVTVSSAANQYSQAARTDAQGRTTLQRLAFGTYQLQIAQPGFAPLSQAVTISSALPRFVVLRLQVAALKEQVTVNAENTLLDTAQPGAVSQIGREAIERRVTAIPGRSIQDLVNTQPGWLYEGNAVLHPRGSEYQTQFVVDGIPLTDNRSPSFGPEIEAEDVQSVSIYTAGIPAEYGRKMGGVVEVNTLDDTRPGAHGDLSLFGGSFDTAGAFASAQNTRGRNTFGASADGSMTGHYLNPVVPENYSNTGTLGDFSAFYQRDLSAADRMNLSVRHDFSRYDIPNEFVQRAAGQRQTADNVETMGIAAYQHTFSPTALLNVRTMVRDNANGFNSNPESTPIEVFQQNSFREGYVNASLTAQFGRHQAKFGIETDNTFLHENFSYIITDPTQFDPGTPLTFAFAGQRPDLEQSAYAEDLLRLGNWTINAGLRWDHYQLLLNRQSLGPRLAVARYFPSARMVAHFSYDRVFQTPSFENILLSSSANVQSLDPTSFLQLPVQPSVGDYFEGGLSKAFGNKLGFDANIYRRVVDNYADDDQIENTTVSFPIAFRKAIIYGAEAKVQVPDFHRFSGYLSYSYMVGNAWLPVVGGLFLGDDATAAETQLAGHFPDSQDQRNTVRARVRYQAHPRIWLAMGAQYDSGLPFEFDGDPSEVLAEYGQAVLDRVNFPRGRIRPAFLLNASAAATLHKAERWNTTLQLDGQNLTNLLDVIDFGGLFSGNAIGPSRSVMLRLQTTF